MISLFAGSDGTAVRLFFLLCGLVSGVARVSSPGTLPCTSSLSR